MHTVGEGQRWRQGVDMVELAETSEADAGSVSSDETGQGADLAERIRDKPSRDVWPLEEILSSLRRLQYAEEIMSFVEMGLYGEIVSLCGTGGGLRTAALWASWRGRAPLLARLLKAGATVTAAGASGTVAGASATAAGGSATAAGASATAADDDGRTCLHLSCLVGSSDCTKLLIEHGANPNQWDRDMQATPLHCAASAKSLPCIKLLVGAGADVNAGLSARSPLHYAVLSDAPDCVKELLDSGACPDTTQVFTETPLHVAASLGSAECARLLVENGADVRAAMGTARATALHLAAEDGHAECAELLLNKGASIDCTNYRMQTPLHLASLAQSVEVVELLVKRGAGVNAKDADGRTPLHGAIVKGARSCDVARILLDAGADPNAADNFGYTPLHIAALNEFSACVCLLLDYGGDVTLRTNGGVSVLSFILRRTPDVLPRYLNKFDEAIHVSEHELGDVDCELSLDFRVLVPNAGRGEAELLLAFIDVGRKDVLKHPLAETFLFLKWRRIRKFFVMSFVYHALFVTLFSVYVLHAYLCVEEVCEVNIFVRPIGYVVMLFNLCLLFKEVFQACHSWTAYIRQWENWVQWAMIVGIFMCAVPTGERKNDMKDTSTWQHDVAAVTIFFSWFELMMIVGRFPTFGLYVQMFTTVTVNFATFLMAYSCLLLAFGLSFSVLFSNYPSFKLVPAGLVKTVMMMSGELEYEDIFYNNQKDYPLHYPVTSHILFLFFVLLVTVILTNLLVGLAVSDIQALQESAGLDRLVRQAQLVAHLESMLFSPLLKDAPRALLAALRKGALLMSSPYRSALSIRPNDPRENRIPKELIASIYKLVASKKDTKRSIRKSNYEFRIQPCRQADENSKEPVKRRSHLYDRYSEGQRVERRRRTTSNSTDNYGLINFSTLQEACLTDIRNQLLDISSKLNKIADSTESKFKALDQKLDHSNHPT